MALWSCLALSCGCGRQAQASPVLTACLPQVQCDAMGFTAFDSVNPQSYPKDANTFSRLTEKTVGVGKRVRGHVTNRLQSEVAIPGYPGLGAGF